MTVALKTFPVFRGVCRTFADSGRPLAEVSDVELFEVIVSAAERVGPEIPFDDDLVPLAGTLEDRLGNGWFAEPTPTADQAYFAVTEGISQVALTRPPLGSTAVIDDKPRGAWWTSSRLPDGTSCWSRGESLIGTPETRARGEFVPRTEHWSTLDVADAAIYRIESTSDFARLLVDYPLEGSAFPRVDWVTVAADFDAVHLSARGLVYTQSVPIETSQGTSALRGWNCESTAWLRTP
jgi:hypothetical protein